LLVATLNVTVPLPVPLVRPVSESHDASELADHTHDDAAATAIELLFVPDAPNVTSFGVTVTLQVVGGPRDGGPGSIDACCVTLTVWPATAMEAARVVVPVFGTAVKLTLVSEKDPDKADIRVVDPRIVEQIQKDFAGYR